MNVFVAADTVFAQDCEGDRIVPNGIDASQANRPAVCILKPVRNSGSGFPPSDGFMLVFNVPVYQDNATSPLRPAAHKRFGLQQVFGPSINAITRSFVGVLHRDAWREKAPPEHPGSIRLLGGYPRQFREGSGVKSPLCWRVVHGSFGRLSPIAFLEAFDGGFGVGSGTHENVRIFEKVILNCIKITSNRYEVYNS